MATTKRSPFLAVSPFQIALEQLLGYKSRPTPIPKEFDGRGLPKIQRCFACKFDKQEEKGEDEDDTHHFYQTPNGIACKRHYESQWKQIFNQKEKAA